MEFDTRQVTLRWQNFSLHTILPHKLHKPIGRPTLKEVLVIERKPNGDEVIRDGNPETAYNV